MTDLVPIRRALISVSDKTHLAEFAKALVNEFKVELISTGGTAKFLRDAGLPVKDVSQVTGFPEMMDGRVKTLHPMVHGGLLAIRDNPEHAKAMKDHNIAPIDLVCINLYPFEKTVSKPNVSFEEAIENIDIGGPSMVRSASKNHQYVTILTSPDQYDAALETLRNNKGASTLEMRKKLALAAFTHTAEYDACISQYLSKVINPSTAELPEKITLSMVKKSSLRYGENPHQLAGLYVDQKTPGAEASVAFAKQHFGKELSYINLLDADAALLAVKEFDAPAACIVKHATPCGMAVAQTTPQAFERAFAGDPLAAYGGIVALNRPVDLPTAQAITAIDKLLEVIVAPSYSEQALELLKTRWKNVRLLEVGPVGKPQQELSAHRIAGGYLVQQRDLAGAPTEKWKVVSNRHPTEQEMADLKFTWIACKHVKSNAIVIGANGMMYGSGAGQQDRVNACRIAVAKSGDRAKGAVAASDAFFPFPDGPLILLDSGVTAIIHPGGSVRDQETLDLINRRGATMVLTGERHFRH